LEVSSELEEVLVVETEEIEVEVTEEEKGGLEALERVEEVSFNLAESP
jgi:hypothetical protein